MTDSRSIHISKNNQTSFLFLAEEKSSLLANLLTFIFQDFFHVIYYHIPGLGFSLLPARQSDPYKPSPVLLAYCLCLDPQFNL